MRRAVLAVALLGVLAFASVAASFGALSAGVPDEEPDAGPRSVVRGGGERSARPGPGGTPTRGCPDCGREPSSGGLLALLPDGPWGAAAAALAVAALAGVAWWYRRTPDGAAGPEGIAPGADDGAAGDDGEPTWSVPSPPPGNDVEAAWRRLRDRAGAGDAETPGEVARRAVRRGLDSTAVEEVTTLFRRVRYGGAEPTEPRERRARRAASDLDDVAGRPDDAGDDG